MNDKILRCEEKIEKLKAKIRKYSEELENEEKNLIELNNSNKLAKIDELMIYFEETNVDMSFDELIDKLKNNKLNLSELRDKTSYSDLNTIN